MADKKISALTGASTPLAGTEVLPIVQSGATVKVAVSDLTAGRAVAATALTMSTGSLVPSTAGQGVNFTANTPAAGMSTQLLNWYEEGTWTPVLTCGTPGDLSVSYSTQVGTYSRIGSRVILNFNIITSAFSYTTASGNVKISGLPFTANGTAGYGYYGSVNFSGFTGVGYTQMVSSANGANLNMLVMGSGIGSGISTISQWPTGGSVVLRGTVIYQV
jgi:hypothetical protein